MSSPLEQAGFWLCVGALFAVQARAALKGGGLPFWKTLTSEEGNPIATQDLARHFYEKPTGKPCYGRALAWSLFALLAFTVGVMQLVPTN